MNSRTDTIYPHIHTPSADIKFWGMKFYDLVFLELLKINKSQNPNSNMNAIFQITKKETEDFFKNWEGK